MKQYLVVLKTRQVVEAWTNSRDKPKIQYEDSNLRFKPRPPNMTDCDLFCSERYIPLPSLRWSEGENEKVTASFLALRP